MLTRADQPVLRTAVLFMLSVAAVDEGHLGEAESLAREAGALVDRLQLQGVPQADLAYIALGRVLAERGDLAGAQVLLEKGLSEKGLSVRRRFPAVSPWATLIGLLALASVRMARDERAEARAVLAEARAILEPFADDAGIFPELLERQERTLRVSKQRNGHLNGEPTERELAVLRLLDSELSVSQMGDSLYVASSTVRTHIKSIYRKLEVTSRKEAVQQAKARELI